MKFKAKLIGLNEGLTPVTTVSTTGVKREYPDEGYIMLTADAKGINAQAHNGYVAITNRIAEQKDLEYECEDAGTITILSAPFLSALGNFSRTDEIVFEKRGDNLVMTNKDDAEIFMTVPVAPRPVEMPAKAPSYDNTIKINRELLLAGMSKVIFAIGWEKYRPEFLYWIMRFDKNSVRFASGDGGRFAVYDHKGTGKVEVSGKTDICLFREQTKDVLPKLLPLLTGDTVTFHVYNSGKSDSDSVPDQVIIESGTASMVLIGHEPGIKWPNEEKFLQRSNNYKVTFAIADCEAPFKGMLATYSEDIKAQHATHVATLDFDFAKKVIYVKTEGTMKSQNKIKMRDQWIAPDADKNLSFTVTSEFLGEVYKYGQKEGRVQMELVNGTSVALVRYYAGDAVSTEPLVNINPTSKEEEKYTIFFGPKAKK